MFIKIYLAIYRCTVIITWEKDVKKIIAWMKKQNKSLDLTGFEDCFNENTGNGKTSGSCFSLLKDNTDILVWVKEKPEKLSQFGVLYHELYHAVDALARDHAMEFEKEIEARAYLFEYLFLEASKVLWNSKKLKK